MVNNKGFLRIIEATFAVIMIITVMFIFFTQSRVQTNVDYSERARDILEEIANDPVLRGEVLDENIELGVESLVKARIPEAGISLDYELRICGVDEACGKSSFTEGNVYSGERIISSTLENPASKKLRLFIWERN